MPGRLLPFVDRNRRFFRPALAYKSPRTRGLVPDFVERVSADGLVLDIGAGGKRVGAGVVTLDVLPLPGLDVVGSAEALPFVDGAFAGAVLQAVLYQVADDGLALDEVARVLAPGGEVLVEAPFVQGYHCPAGDHRRYTEQGLGSLLERHGFTVLGSGVVVGPASAMASVGAEFLALLVSGRSANAYRIARVVTGLLAAPVKFADRWLDAHPMAYTIASGVWVRARRP